MKNDAFSKTQTYDYPAFQPENCKDQPIGSNVTKKKAASPNINDSVTKSITDNNSSAMSMKNPLYVPSTKTQMANEENT